MEYSYELLIMVYDEKSHHYYQLIYDTENKFNKNNNVKIVNSSNSNIIKGNNYNPDLIQDIHELILKYQNLNINNNPEKKNQIQNNKLNFEDLLNIGYNYPPYPNKKWGWRILLDIRSYLISKLINPKKVKYPEYILNINNVENEKRYFRNIASNYALDKCKNLYIKYYKNNKKDKLDYELYTVPFVQDINRYIDDLHKKLEHRNHNIVREYLIKRKIFFKGIYNTIKNICNKCGICVAKNKAKAKKK